MIAGFILRSHRVKGVALGSVRGADPIHEVQRDPIHEVQRHVGAVVLAAGLSSRMGQSKVLLPWSGGRVILEHILEQLRLAHVSNVTVVTGHRSGEVTAIAQRTGAAIAFNADYATGEMLWRNALIAQGGASCPTGPYIGGTGCIGRSTLSTGTYYSSSADCLC